MSTRTPLHFAVINGQVDALTVLLANGADVNAKDIYSWAAPHITARHGQIDALKVLVANGADVNVASDTGETAADVATGECVAYLAELKRQTLPELRKQLNDTECQLEEATRQLKETERIIRQAKGAAEASLTALIQDVAAVVSGPGGWASPLVDPAAEAQLAIEGFVKAREALSTSLAEAAATTADPVVIAQLRADCCATATVLLDRLPLPENGASVGISAAVPRPPLAFVDQLTEAVSAAKNARTAALAAVEHAVSACHECGTVAEVIQAAMAVDAACAPHVDTVRAKLSAARAAVAAAAPTPALSAEECRHHRAAAECVLEVNDRVLSRTPHRC